MNDRETAEREVRVTVHAPARLTLTEIAEMFWDKLDVPGSVFRVVTIAVSSAPSCMPGVRERYEREAQERLASRIGPELAEEFFSVARDTDRDAVNVAELMAAAYKKGRVSAEEKEQS